MGILHATAPIGRIDNSFRCRQRASSNDAPRILENLGATVIRRGCAPNGKNINDKVGALHPPEDIGNADIAICLDGDGDRVILVDQNGTLDGDDMSIFSDKQQQDQSLVRL